MPRTSTKRSKEPAPISDRLVYSDHDLDRAGLPSRCTRYRWRRLGRFPQPMQAGGRILYAKAAIEAWLADPQGWAAAEQARRKNGGAA